MSSTIYGIDLGTTNSCLAVMEPAGPRVIEIDGQPVVPSVVSFDRGGGRTLVGQRARNRLLLEPETTVRSIKRRLGQCEMLQLGDRQFAPEEIAAEILRYLKRQGEAAEGHAIERAVITVPAYFEDAQRRATIRAGELAGLEVVRILNEPTAAALLYDRLLMRGGAGRRDDDRAERILVYDLGGGTFDVSVVEISRELDQVRASGGDARLGGDDFDQAIVARLLEHLRVEHGRDLAADARALARLTAAAELVKIDLSSMPYARVIEEALAPGLHLDLEIARASFEEWIGGPLDGTLAEVDRALAEARLEASAIERVVLVGGSTSIPRVREMLVERFECPVGHAVDPALCVALGAAVQGAILGGELFDHILVDVAAHSLGVKAVDDAPGLFGRREADYFAIIIRRNSQIPTTRSEVYYTMVDEQETVEIEVYQGERPRCSHNTLIDSFPFDLEPAPEGSPVVVEFAYDTDGIIRVRVHQKDTENRRQVTLDTRRRTPAAPPSDAPPSDAVDNYMIRKARKVGAELAAGDLRERLLAAAVVYETALASESADPGEVDRLEDELLECLEEAEEAVVAT